MSPSAAQILGRDADDLLGSRLFMRHRAPEGCAGGDAAIRGSASHVVAPGDGPVAPAAYRNGSWVHTDNICTNLIHDENVRGLVLNDA